MRLFQNMFGFLIKRLAVICERDPVSSMRKKSKIEFFSRSRIDVEIVGCETKRASAARVML